MSVMLHPVTVVAISFAVALAVTLMLLRGRIAHAMLDEPNPR